MAELQGYPGLYPEQRITGIIGNNAVSIDLLGNYNDTYGNVETAEDIPGATGTSSIFNKYTIFSLEKCSFNSTGAPAKYDTELLLDINDSTVDFDQNITKDQIGNTIINGYSDKRGLTPTASDLIDYSKSQTADSSLYGPMPYAWSDFLYCKYYGKIPNNHLITLRRYPTPVYDSAKSSNGQPLLPIAQAITFLGEETGNKLSDIMKMTYGLIWKEIEAQVQSVDGNEVGMGAGVETFAGDTKMIGRLGNVKEFLQPNSDRWSGKAKAEQDWLKGAWGNDGPYWNQVYGPVNVVTKSHMRDRGMNFTQQIKLNFHYSLKSIDGINPKVAMLDLIANFLTLTYNNAKFWGGALRYFPNYKDQVGFMGDQDKFYSGDWEGYFSSFKNSMQSLGGSFSDMLGKIMQGGFTMSNIQDVIKQLGGKLTDQAMGNLARQSRPQILSIRNLLSGDPVGEWHLTIGNPINPIAVMGNMLIESTDLQLGDTLGMDDFPTEVTFVITLKHGRPRDKGDIESMFNFGAGKLYLSPFSRFPSEGNTFGDANKKDASFFKDKESAAKWTPESFENAEGTDKTGIVAMSASNYKKARSKITNEYGQQFGDSPNLAWLFGKTRIKF